MAEKLVAREVLLAYALLGKAVYYLGFGGYAGMVCSWYPAGVLALQTGAAHEYVLNGIVEHVTHVEHSGHVGWRYDDGVRLATIGFAAEQFVVKPILVPFALYFGWTVLCFQFHILHFLYIYSGAKLLKNRHIFVPLREIILFWSNYTRQNEHTRRKVAGFRTLA